MLLGCDVVIALQNRVHVLLVLCESCENFLHCTCMSWWFIHLGNDSWSTSVLWEEAFWSWVSLCFSFWGVQVVVVIALDLNGLFVFKWVVVCLVWASSVLILSTFEFRLGILLVLYAHSVVLSEIQLCLLFWLFRVWRDDMYSAVLLVWCWDWVLFHPDSL